MEDRFGLDEASGAVMLGSSVGAIMKIFPIRKKLCLEKNNSRDYDVFAWF